MTGASLNLHLSDLLRDTEVTNYGYAERLAAINTVISSIHQELIRAENYLARTYTSVSLTIGYAYYDLPSNFYQHWEGGAFIGDKWYPLALTDARERITFGDANMGTPTFYWFEPNDDGSMRMEFDCSPYNAQTMHIEYFTTPPVWTKTGKDPSVDADALDIINDNSTPYGALFDYGIAFLAAASLIGRNNFKSRDTYERWGQQAVTSAMSVAHKGNLARMQGRPIHGARMAVDWKYSTGGSRASAVVLTGSFVLGMAGGVWGVGGSPLGGHA